MAQEKSINKLILDFLDYLEVEKNRSKKTAENYNHYLQRFLDWLQEKFQKEIIMPKEIDLETIKKYRLWLNRFTFTTKSGKETYLRKQTQNYHVIAIRGFLKYLAKNDIECLPAEKIELAQQSPRQIDFLEPEELIRLLSSPKENHIRGLRDKAILELLFSTGLRVSELTNLNRQSVNLKKDEFTIRGKGDKLRLVFLSDTAKKYLEEYLAKRTDINPALFVRIPKKGQLKVEVSRLTPRSIQRIVNRHAVKAGITKNVTPHTIRHSYATDLLLNGADIRSVQSLLGHANVSTTQIYTHLTDNQLKETYQKFHDKRREE